MDIAHDAQIFIAVVLLYIGGRHDRPLPVSDFCVMLAVIVTTYRLNTKDLESRFIDSIKTAYLDQFVEIQVREQDEAEYLLGTPASRQCMEKSSRNPRREAYRVRNAETGDASGRAMICFLDSAFAEYR